MEFIGIDVAKAQLEYGCRPSGETGCVTNDDPGIRDLVTRCHALTPTLIVLEATGGYEAALVAALAIAGLSVVVANPRQVRDFAKATGHLAKTDAIAAQFLALFAERVQPAPRPLPDETTQALDALLTRRRQLVEMLTAERNRLLIARAPVRAALYMAALVASKCNPVIRAFYLRLRAARKPAKVALTACMRKLLVILNAMARSGTPWQPERRLVRT
jgi:transposase